MNRRRLFLAAPAVLVASCARTPESYPPPMQRSFVARDRIFLQSQVRMTAADADSYLVSGTLPSEPRAMWRWAGKRAVLRFLLPDVLPHAFFADFVINETTFEKTGPVTMSFFVGEKLLGAERYDKPGAKHYETKVPESVLAPGAPVEVAIEVDKVFTAPTDGKQLGFLISAAGFRD